MTTNQTTTNKLENNSINAIITLLENHFEETIEYIYIDQSILKRHKQQDLLSKEKIFITTDNNNIQMIDFELNEKDILNYAPKVDLLIIDHHQRNQNFTKHMIDKHTIISKIISEDIIYIEDALNELKIVIAKDETYIFKENTNYKQFIPDEFKYT